AGLRDRDGLPQARAAAIEDVEVRALDLLALEQTAEVPGLRVRLGGGGSRRHERDGQEEAASGDEGTHHGQGLRLAPVFESTDSRDDRSKWAAHPHVGRSSRPGLYLAR